MSESTYNGWKNYETWCVNLWLSNDEGTYNAVRELVTEAREEWDEEEHPDWDEFRYHAADAIKAFTEELPECVEVQEKASFVSDLLGAALSEVDWSEIADGWIADVAEEVTQ